MEIKERLFNEDCLVMGINVDKLKPIAKKYDLDPVICFCVEQELKCKAIAGKFNCNFHDTVDFLLDYAKQYRLSASVLISNVSAIAGMLDRNKDRGIKDLKHVAWLCKDGDVLSLFGKEIDASCYDGTAILTI
jgi:hypothetical protein|tara:strand:- start:745 stop:1143 length:399 start_codon:yes stop_codon:yes gene_type:complete